MPPLEGEIILEAHAERSYSDAETVDVHYTIINHSKNAMTVVETEDLLRIKLIGPDDKLVRPYPYRYVRASHIYMIKSYSPDAKHDSWIRLAALFPFPMAGEYRCILTRRVYQQSSPELPNSNDLFNSDYYGKPVDVTAPELKFRVEQPTRPDRPRQAVDLLNHIYEPGLEYDTMPTKDHPVRGESQIEKTQQHSATTSPQDYDSSLPTAKTKAAAQVKTEKADGSQSQPETKSWFVWLLVVVVGTVGAVWAFLRKSK